MIIKLYTLTEEEINSIEVLNQSKTNSLMLICQHGQYTGVDADDLQKEEFSDYLNLLGGLDINKIVEVTLEE